MHVLYRVDSKTGNASLCSSVTSVDQLQFCLCAIVVVMLVMGLHDYKLYAKPEIMYQVCLDLFLSTCATHLSLTGSDGETAGPLTTSAQCLALSFHI